MSVAMESGDEVVHYGSCHCGAVQWQVTAPQTITCFDCNCSICYKKSNFHFIVPTSKFKLLKGEDQLTCYQFNKMIAKHTFCTKCGVQSFYTPRSNPDGVGVNPRCMDSDTVTEIVYKKCCGKNWEKNVGENPEFKNLSKEVE